MYWQRKNNKYVCVYVYEDGRPKQLPRKLTRHLDTQPDDAIDHWVHSYRLEKPQSTLPEFPQHWTDCKRKYLEFLTESKAPETVYHHGYCLVTHVFPYFLNHTRDMNEFPLFSIRLRQFMVAKSCSKSMIRGANSALRGLWKYCLEEGYITCLDELRLRPPGIPRNQTTPLGRVLTPEEVLQFINGADRKITLIAILGYFCSLRPQEIFGLNRGDFRAKDEIEACRAMRAVGLYGKLAVRVERQKRGDGSTVAPKASSKGWVACFDKNAAEALVTLLRGMSLNEQLFQYSNDWLTTLWKREGIQGITIKDLRRASLYWLGHYSKIDYATLKNHARHADPNTTWLYLRRPDDGWMEEDDLAL
jgi:integrase